MNSDGERGAVINNLAPLLLVASSMLVFSAADAKGKQRGCSLDMSIWSISV